MLFWFIIEQKCVNNKGEMYRRDLKEMGKMDYIKLGLGDFHLLAHSKFGLSYWLLAPVML